MLDDRGRLSLAARFSDPRRRIRTVLPSPILAVFFFVAVRDRGSGAPP
jgi:hypothetical protein